MRKTTILIQDPIDNSNKTTMINLADLVEQAADDTTIYLRNKNYLLDRKVDLRDGKSITSLNKSLDGDKMGVIYVSPEFVDIYNEHGVEELFITNPIDSEYRHTLLYIEFKFEFDEKLLS